MDEDFRADAKVRISCLLDRWKSVESSIKEAEQISSEEQIPAINELRYAARQLFNAFLYFDNPDLTKEEKEKINNRITVADQYLHNAEHDISDSIVTFYDHVCIDAEDRYGRSVITTHFPQFPSFRETIRECKRLVVESRRNYELRGDNYTKIRENHIPHLLSMHDALLDAQVGAEEERRRTQHAIRIANGKFKVSLFVLVFLAIVAIIEPIFF